jgi:DNA-binding transcriptional regulator YdaS (Cro superfamily)
MNTVIQAIDRIGGTELARRLGCSKQLVSFWRTGRQRVPAETAVDIERVTHGAVRRHELRPDLWPEPVERRPERSAA